MPLARNRTADNDTGQLSLSDSFDDEDAFVPSEQLAASNELRELAQLQLGLLISFLEPRLAATPAQLAARCALYCRSPGSLPAGKLQLQLIAASDGREAEAAQRRQDLILGMPEGNGQYQESWIVEQDMIVLPDSGGLVLPLAHNGFLVGLLVVERCSPLEGTGSIAGQLQPPACTVFGAEDLAFIKRSGAALALACAMDLRAALERAGHTVRQRQMQGLVREVRKPLTTLRTLGAMLAPRLQPGEPERDLSDGIVAQGERLGELVNQLQTALSPPVAPILPPETSEALKAPQYAIPGAPGTPSLQQLNTLQPGGTGPVPQLQYPALPSSTIGADNWSPATALPVSSATTDANPIDAARTNGGSSTHEAPAAPSPQSPPEHCTGLASVLVPLLASATNFAAVSGVTFLLAPQEQGTSGVPDVQVAADVMALKRMLGQLLDSTIACAAAGDCIELSFLQESWRGAEGVAVAVRLLQAMGPGGGRSSSVAADADGHVYLQEFASLASMARKLGGWFDVKVDSAAQVVQHSMEVHTPAGGSLSAVLWLPIGAAGDGDKVAGAAGHGAVDGN